MATTPYPAAHGPEPEVPRLARDMWKRFAIGGVLIILFAAASTATAGLLEVKSLTENLAAPANRLRNVPLTRPQVGGPQTILLLGSDRRKFERQKKLPGRSDTMILIRLDPDKQAIAVLSIPRDLKVPIHLPNGLTQTDKINAAYSLGGPALITKTIGEVLGININHVANIDFKGFRKAVDFLGCVYLDIDRRYFNQNLGTASTNYASIDIKPGYQKLCGPDALDYVRYRHTDTDLVRAARQQDFLAQIKEQNSTQKLLGDRGQLAKIIGRYMQTDIHSVSQVLELLKLVAFSAGNPIREVHFESGFATERGVSYVVATPEQIRTSTQQFLNAQASKGPKGSLRSTAAERIAAKRRKKRKPGPVPGLENAKMAGEDQVIAVTGKIHFPVFYPVLRTAGAVFSDVPRVYTLRDESSKLHHAYRMVIKKGLIGEYYGIQGMDWTDPPILRQSHDTERYKGRDYLVYYDGNRISRIAWKTKSGVYWVGNTLLRSLDNKQLRAIARSCRVLGRQPA